LHRRRAPAVTNWANGAHTRDEVDQATLVCIGKVTTNGFDAGTDADALAIQIDIATTRTEALMLSPRVPLAW